jgi:hypothetical protein
MQALHRLAEPPPVHAEAQPDQLWASRYRIKEKIRKGGMGDVYLAHDVVLDRYIALKVLRKTSDESFVDETRLLREARAAARVEHERLACVYDAFTWNDQRNRSSARDALFARPQRSHDAGWFRPVDRPRGTTETPSGTGAAPPHRRSVSPRGVRHTGRPANRAPAARRRRGETGHKWSFASHGVLGRVHRIPRFDFEGSIELSGEAG